MLGSEGCAGPSTHIAVKPYLNDLLIYFFFAVCFQNQIQTSTLHFKQYWYNLITIYLHMGQIWKCLPRLVHSLYQRVVRLVSYKSLEDRSMLPTVIHIETQFIIKYMLSVKNLK
jgi:hypothetical protein